MARARRNDEAVRELHQAFTRLARKHRFDGGAKDIERWAWDHGIEISDVTIQKVLNGEADPTAVMLELLFVIRAFFHAGPGDLGAHAEARLAPFDQLIARRAER